MNTKKKEKSMLRKEGYVYVLDLFARYHPALQRQSRTRPWRSMQSIKLQTEESEGGESRSTATAQLFVGRRGRRGRQAQASWSRKTAIG